jgi:Holliday junction resolvasome RuvABC endonuclease subunit
LRILSFDVSSTTLAYAILELNISTNEIKYISSNYIKPIKNKPILEKLVHTRLQIVDIIEKSKPDQIVIEDIISFMKHKSSATTIITLALFNRMVCLTSYDYLKDYPILYNVLSIRHGLRRASGLAKLPAKEDIPDIVSKLLKFDFPFEFKKNGKRKDESEDKADAIAVGLHHALLLITPKQIKIKKTNEKSKTKDVKNSI